MISSLSGGVRTLFSNPVTPWIIGGLATGYKAFVEPLLLKNRTVSYIKGILEEAVPAIKSVIDYIAPYVADKGEMIDVLSKRPPSGDLDQSVVPNRKKRKKE